MNLIEKKSCVANAKACFNCLTPGHQTKDCKSKGSCRTCKKKHHSAMCNDNSKKKDEKSKEKPKPQNLGDTNVETLKTESASDPATGIADIEDITENNMRRCYELTSAEIYFMSNQDRVSRNLTCVGSVRVKGLVTSEIVQTMFDVCSTDNWLVIEHAHKLGAKKVGEFQGIVKTINGHERSTLPRYEVRVQMSDSNWTKIHCLGVKNIGWKPQIEECRFQRLCKEFGVRSSEVDNTAGPIGLLLGLKNQSLLATRVASFQSTRFPEVGLYASPVLQNKYIFVGHEGLSDKNSPTMNYRISAYDGSLHKYIMQEQQVKLSDIKCEVCTKSFDCKGCKDLNIPVTIVQLEESNAIK